MDKKIKKSNEHPYLIKSATLRKMADEVRVKALEIEQEKLVKSAKFILGVKSLMQIKNKLS